jgi:hypothetical protein
MLWVSNGWISHSIGIEDSVTCPSQSASTLYFLVERYMQGAEKVGNASPLPDGFEGERIGLSPGTLCQIVPPAAVLGDLSLPFDERGLAQHP